MSNVRNVIATCIFAVILTDVSAWTIDLPEVRKYLFERNKYKHGDENKIYFDRGPGLVDYNNIEGNSPHNTPQLHEGVNGGQYDGNSVYAHDYRYYTYMEKNVHGIFHKGSIYLEGLRRAMERYSEQLENCSKLERTRPPTNSSWVPEPEAPPRPLSAAETASIACARATRESEHIRRLASLVVWAIGELQDIAYAKDYDKEDKQSEEDVLLLQLAWALDELARLTGYEPDPKEFATEPTPAPAPSTTPLTFFNLPIPNDGPTNSNCIKDKSSDAPVTVRCALPLPAVVLQFLNMTGGSGSPATANTSQEMMRLLALFNNSSGARPGQAFAGAPPAAARRQMLSCITDDAPDPDACADFLSFLEFLNSTFPQQLQQPNFQQRPNRETDSSQLEILETAEGHSVAPLRGGRRRRAPDDPFTEFSKYYFKYKSWTNSNPGADVGSDARASDGFDVENDLAAAKSVQKRSVNVKDGIVARVPQDPMGDLSGYVKHKSGVHYNRDAAQAEKIRAYLKKILHGAAGKRHLRRLGKLIKSVHKRSVQYGRLHRPRVPEDPQQDISYYVKAKAGTRARADPAQAAQVRAGLREIYERGNIEVVRRFGSNYVPGVPVVIAGGIESFTDF